MTQIDGQRLGPQTVNGLERLDEETCWTLLGQKNLGRVGVVQHGQPMIFPVNYAIDNRSIVVRTERGAKLTAAILKHRAVFEIDAADPLFHTGFSVMVHGYIYEITDEAELAAARALPLRPWAGGERDRYVRIVADSVSGRRIKH